MKALERAITTKYLDGISGDMSRTGGSLLMGPTCLRDEDAGTLAIRRNVPKLLAPLPLPLPRSLLETPPPAPPPPPPPCLSCGLKPPLVSTKLRERCLLLVVMGSSLCGILARWARSACFLGKGLSSK